MERVKASVEQGVSRVDGSSSGRPVVAALPLRIRHVDSLRALAAYVVVWFHFDQTLAPITAPEPALLGWLHAVPRFVDIGRVAVMIFFAVSGFVVCRSFDGPRRGGVRRFVVRRFCRLYPAYWVSMLGGLLVWAWHGQTWTAAVLAANATMVPAWLDQPRLLGVYWTLEIELLFYGCCLGLYVLRCLERRALLATLIVVLCSLTRVLRAVDHHAGTHWALPPGKPILLLTLAVMFWGVLFRLAYDETGGFRRDVWRHGGTWLVAGLGVALIELPEPNMKWFLLGLWHGPVPGHVPVLCAVLIFAGWVACLRVDNPWLTYLGAISYSVYLFHPAALYAVERCILVSPTVRGWHLPVVAFLGAGTVLTTLVAMAVYRWVERPAIALGKRWAGIHRGVMGNAGAATP